ncbi:MAG: type VI secretion system baseplate subunit TssE [Myxococcales bacterium]|nr:type VI secretion system baseplate subunit TssE [Myxococcales bacterium]
MADYSQREQLQPSLLDRLVDDEPGEKNESRKKRVLSIAQIRECVRRDLASLLNATHLEGLQDLSLYPEVSRSVLNYGIPDLAGRTLSDIDPPEIEQALRQAILDFEPRLLRDTVRVTMVASDDGSRHNAMQFVIEADVWAQPLPLQLFLKTQIDLEDGNVRIVDAGRQV